jgi:propanol-preferring alcohol dehydrogenase
MSSEGTGLAGQNKLPDFQKAVIVTKPGPDARVRIEDVQIPKPGPEEVLIHLSYTGVCHADIAFILGEWDNFHFSLEGSQTPGHEGVGRVVALGSNVTNFTIGDRVGTKWIRDVCGACSLCIRGKESLCTSQTTYGRNSPGSFQQYVTSPANYTPRIPEAISDEKAGPILCAGVTMYRGLKVSGAVAGEWVVIVGAGGGLGHLGIQYALKMGFKVIAIDSGDKESLCMSLGASTFIDFAKTPDVPNSVHSITGVGASAVLVCTGSRKSYEQAARMLSNGGTLVCIGLPTEAFHIPILPVEFLGKGAAITGINASSVKDIEDALDFAAHNGIIPTVQTFPMAQAQEAFDKLHQQKTTGRVVLDLRSP